MKKIIGNFLFLAIAFSIKAQTPVSLNAAEILLGLKKLNMSGSVLYIAAHPDDENSRLLAYFSKERLLRTGYLAMTRGDGGQNLIGDEQGLELGLIRTQELLAARRIDGAEQYFTRAYDFGFSKSTEEALTIWNEEKILSDVVWVIRKFQPDIIVTRFPEDNRAGHGHHSASAVLARKAFIAAADNTKFVEQFKYGVKPWQAKRIVWNTFNFGSNNTQNENQLKINVGVYNTLLGKSYGEIAAESRTNHKSQGFGVPRVRGEQTEFFTHVAGEAMKQDLMDDLELSWMKLNQSPADKEWLLKIQLLTDSIIQQYSFTQPALSVNPLVQLYKMVLQLSDGNWKTEKLKQIQRLIEACAGLYMEATTIEEYAVQGDSIKINFSIINRSSASILLNSITINDHLSVPVKNLEPNKNLQIPFTILIDSNATLSQPYWINDKLDKGSFHVEDQLLIGEPELKNENVHFKLTIEEQVFDFARPILYKHTDPVKGELFQPLIITPPIVVNGSPNTLVFNVAQPNIVKATVTAKSFTKIEPQLATGALYKNSIWVNKTDSLFTLDKGQSKKFEFELDDALVESKRWNNRLIELRKMKATDKNFASNKSKQTLWENSKIYHSKQISLRPFINTQKKFDNYSFGLAQRKIQYDHIPTIHYFFQDWIKGFYVDVKTDGKNIGYIVGAGDKVPEALKQMGYSVTVLTETDLTIEKLKKFDAVITGVRAYNVHEYLNDAYPALMQYIYDGGTLLVQYNTSNQIGPVKAKISPYDFFISRSRITDETAKVNFLIPDHPFLNYPNKITEEDFKDWVQERSVYEAEKLDSNFKSLLSFADPNEKASSGSLIVANYGKGRFVYTGLVFFRELPAGVPGAYRLFANLIARRNRN